VAEEVLFRIMVSDGGERMEGRRRRGGEERERARTTKEEQGKEL